MQKIGIHQKFYMKNYLVKLQKLYSILILKIEKLIN